MPGKLQMLDQGRSQQNQGFSQNLIEMKSEKIEKRFTQLAFSGNGFSVNGIVITYGDTALIAGRFQERFQPGAFGDVESLDVILNVQHDRSLLLARTGENGGLSLRQSENRIEMRAALPDTTAGRDAAELVSRGVLRGFSVEFQPLRERSVNGVRVIEQARLSAIGLVARPAYSQSTIARRWYESTPEARQATFYL